LLEDSLKVAVCWLADFIHKLTLQLAKLQSSDNHLIIKHKGFYKTKHTKSTPHHNPKIISTLAQLCNFATLQILIQVETQYFASQYFSKK
ncbi:MAG: hypothetical protein J6R43_06190, partial [Paludibacteraceae bacterium]|nr:hypothetical protein [Paludibacteraceae bacterium]